MALTNDDLLAISHLLDVKFKAEVQPIKSEIHNLSDEIQAVKAELQGEIQSVKAELEGQIQAVKAELEGQIQAVKAELEGQIQAVYDNLEGQIQAVYDNLQGQIHQIKLFQETMMMPRLNTIEACYLSTYNRYKDSVEGYETLQADNEIMKSIIMDHSAKLQKLA